MISLPVKCKILTEEQLILQLQQTLRFVQAQVLELVVQKDSQVSQTLVCRARNREELLPSHLL